MPFEVIPKNISLRARQTQAFRATGATGPVAWSIAPTSGRIDPHGVYTAPLAAPRHTNVTVKAQDGARFATADITLDPGWFWLHFLGLYWLAWAALLLGILLWGWERLCPNCRTPELLLNPPVASVTASQPVRLTATAPVAWPENVSANGLYTAPAAPPANSRIDITATAAADPKRTASASLIWSNDIGLTLSPQNAVLPGEGRLELDPIFTVAPEKQGQIDLSKAVVEWLQPPVGSISARGANGAAVFSVGNIRRATTIMVMANGRVPGGPPRAAGAYITLLPKSPAGACQEDGTPGIGSLIALIAVAGALGGLIHGASSFAIFAGNREFQPSWTWWYVLRPLLGGAVALVVLLVVRSGLGTADLALSGADCLKTAGLAGLVGMFAEPAMLKLKDIFNTLFTPREDPRKDALALEKSRPQGGASPPATSE
jgi:hypothetical protein